MEVNRTNLGRDCTLHVVCHYSTACFLKVDNCLDENYRTAVNLFTPLERTQIQPRTTALKSLDMNAYEKREPPQQGAPRPHRYWMAFAEDHLLLTYPRLAVVSRHAATEAYPLPGETT